TIAIVDAHENPYVASDLHRFDQRFGLKDPPSFKKVNQSGGTALPSADSLWAAEIALDVQWAHAIAPAANLVLVEADSGDVDDLMAAVDTARHLAGVSVVSMSWSGPEFEDEGQFDAIFTTPEHHEGVTFVAASGDR